MSGFDSHSRDLSRYNHMSTEELEKILRADFELPEGEESDTEKILYITEVIAQRKAGQPTGRYADTNAAWGSFVEQYLPETEKEAFAPQIGIAAKPRKKRKALIRAAAVAAVLALILTTGTVTASAFGFDFWAWLSAWSQEVFGVQNVDITFSEVDYKIPEQLTELYEAMEEYGFPENLLPTYLPDGYEAAETECEANSIVINLYCLLENEDAPITLNYTMYLTDQMTNELQKDEDDPDKYRFGEVSHQIMTNYGIYRTVWTVDNIECVISGLESREELIKMIDSIYGG